MIPTPLHVQTYFSLRGGSRSPAEWCDYAASLGYTALGIADRAPLTGVHAFEEAARRAGIKPLYGIEVDVRISLPLVDGPRPPKSRKSEAGTAPVDPEDVLLPLLLYARNQAGLVGLARCASEAFAGWPRTEKSLAWETLVESAEGLLAIVLSQDLDGTAPLGSVIPKRLSMVGASLHEAFDGMVFMGLPAPRLGDDTPTRQAQATANYMGIPAVALPKAQYPQAADVSAYKALCALRGSMAELTQEHHLMSPDEIAAVYSAWPEALAVYSSIAEMCSGVDWAEAHQDSGYDSSHAEKLTERAEAGLRSRIKDVELAERYILMLNDEIRLVSASQMCLEWLTLADLVECADSSGIAYGATYGTSKCPLLAYALGISDYNPTATDEGAREDLIDSPTIGIEVAEARRAKLLVEFNKQFGKGKVALAGCFTEIAPSTAVRGAALAQRPLSDVVSEVTKVAFGGGWEALGGKHSSEATVLANCAAQLRGEIMDACPDEETLVLLSSRENGEALLPIIEGSTAPGGWIPWTAPELRALGARTITIRLSAALDLLEKFPQSGAKADEVVSSRVEVPTLTAHGMNLLREGWIAGIPYLTASAARTLAATAEIDESGSAGPSIADRAMRLVEQYCTAVTLLGSANSIQNNWTRAKLALRAVNIKGEDPAAFIAAALDSAWRNGQTSELKAIAAEARNMQIDIVAPEASLSDAHTIVVMQHEKAGSMGTLRVGLAQVPGWNHEAAKKFIAGRSDDGFSSMRDVLTALHEAGLGPTHLCALINSGACDVLGGTERNRASLVEFGLQFFSQDGSEQETAGATLIAVSQLETTIRDERATFSAMAPSSRERYERRKWESLHFGIEFTGAEEIDALHAALERSGGLKDRLSPISELSREHTGQSKSYVGVLSGIRIIRPEGADLQSPSMASGTLEDGDGSIELVAFPQNYQRYAGLWIEGLPLIVTARVSAHSDGDLYLLCEQIAPLESGDTEAEMEFKLRVKSKGAKNPLADTEIIAEAKAVIGNSYGRTSAHADQVTKPSSSRDEKGIQTLSDTLARFRLIITLPQLDDDQEAIDNMLELKRVLSAHPGDDPVLLRIPYIGGSRHMATAQLPLGVRHDGRLAERLEKLFGAQAVAVIELQPHFENVE